MEVYRLTRTRYAGDLSGEGAARFPGRWNLPGQPALYTAGSRALALLEVLAHLPRQLVPTDFLLQTIHLPELPAPMTFPAESLPDTWRGNPPAQVLRQLGGAWLEKHQVIRVPSTLVPEDWNIVLGPGLLTSGALRLVREAPFEIDGRLLFSGDRPQQA